MHFWDFNFPQKQFFVIFKIVLENLLTDDIYEISTGLFGVEIGGEWCFV